MRLPIRSGGQVAVTARTRPSTPVTWPDNDGSWMRVCPGRLTQASTTHTVGIDTDTTVRCPRLVRVRLGGAELRQRRHAARQPERAREDDAVVEAGGDVQRERIAELHRRRLEAGADGRGRRRARVAATRRCGRARAARRPPRRSAAPRPRRGSACPLEPPPFLGPRANALSTSAESLDEIVTGSRPSDVSRAISRAYRCSLSSRRCAACDRRRRTSAVEWSRGSTTGTATPATAGKLRSQSGSCRITGTTSQPWPSASSHVSVVRRREEVREDEHEAARRQVGAARGRGTRMPCRACPPVRRTGRTGRAPATCQSARACPAEATTARRRRSRARRRRPRAASALVDDRLHRLGERLAASRATAAAPGRGPSPGAGRRRARRAAPRPRRCSRTTNASPPVPPRAARSPTSRSTTPGRPARTGGGRSPRCRGRGGGREVAERQPGAAPPWHEREGPPLAGRHRAQPSQPGRGRRGELEAARSRICAERGLARRGRGSRRGTTRSARSRWPSTGRNSFSTSSGTTWSRPCRSAHARAVRSSVRLPRTDAPSATPSTSRVARASSTVQRSTSSSMYTSSIARLELHSSIETAGRSYSIGCPCRCARDDRAPPRPRRDSRARPAARSGRAAPRAAGTSPPARSGSRSRSRGTGPGAAA